MMLLQAAPDGQGDRRPGAGEGAQPAVHGRTASTPSDRAHARRGGQATGRASGPPPGLPTTADRHGGEPVRHADPRTRPVRSRRPRPASSPLSGRRWSHPQRHGVGGLPGRGSRTRPSCARSRSRASPRSCRRCRWHMPGARPSSGCKTGRQSRTWCVPFRSRPGLVVPDLPVAHRAAGAGRRLAPEAAPVEDGQGLRLQVIWPLPDDGWWSTSPTGSRSVADVRRRSGPRTGAGGQ